MITSLHYLALLVGFVATATALAVPMPAPWPAAGPDPCDGSHDFKCLKPRAADAAADVDAFSPTHPGPGSNSAIHKRGASPHSHGPGWHGVFPAPQAYDNPYASEPEDVPYAPVDSDEPSTEPLTEPVDAPPAPGQPIHPKTIVDQPKWLNWPTSSETGEQKQKREANANANPTEEVETAEQLKKALKITDAENGMEPIIAKRAAKANANPTDGVETAEQLKKALKITDAENGIEPIIAKRAPKANANPTDGVETAEQLKKALKITDAEDGIEPIVAKRAAHQETPRQSWDPVKEAEELKAKMIKKREAEAEAGMFRAPYKMDNKVAMNERYWRG